MIQWPVGDRVLDSKTYQLYEVKSLSGVSSRCTEPGRPVRAALVLAPASEEYIKALCRDVASLDSLDDARRRETLKKMLATDLTKEKCQAL